MKPYKIILLSVIPFALITGFIFSDNKPTKNVDDVYQTYFNYCVNNDFNIEKIKQITSQDVNFHKIPEKYLPRKPPEGSEFYNYKGSNIGLIQNECIVSAKVNINSLEKVNQLLLKNFDENNINYTKAGSISNKEMYLLYTKDGPKTTILQLVGNNITLDGKSLSQNDINSLTP